MNVNIQGSKITKIFEQPPKSSKFLSIFSQRKNRFSLFLKLYFVYFYISAFLIILVHSVHMRAYDCKFWHWARWAQWAQEVQWVQGPLGQGTLNFSGYSIFFICFVFPAFLGTQIFSEFAILFFCFSISGHSRIVQCPVC